MPIVYEIADKNTTDLFNLVMNKAHKVLVDHKVRLSIMEVRSLNKEGDSLGPSLKKNRTHVPGKVRIVPLRERVNRDVEGEVYIDGEWWDGMVEKEKIAVADSLISYLTIKYDADGIACLDDLDRVRLKLKGDDFTLFGHLQDITNKNHPTYQKFQALVETVNGIVRSDEEIDADKKAEQDNVA
jgi:hypothetical protein